MTTAAPSRIDADADAVAEAWRTLGRSAADLGDEPARPILEVLGRYYGVPVSPSALTDPDLAGALRTAGLQRTEVRLGPSWHTDSGGPLVVFEIDSGAPVVLLPTAHGYRLPAGYRPDRRLTAVVAGGFAPVAWQLYPPLDEAAKTTARGLLRFAARGAGPDARFLVLAGLLSAVVGGALPLISGWLVTRVATGGIGGGVLWWTAALLTGFVVGNALLLSARNAALVRLQCRLQFVLEPAVWGHLLGRDVQFLSGLGTADLVQRANSVTDMRRAIGTGAASAVLGSAFGLVSLAAIMIIDPVVGGCVLAATLLLLAGASVAAARQQRFETINRQEFSKVASFLHASLLAIEKIQASGREERVFAGWTARYAEQRHADVAAKRWQGIVTALSGALQPAILAALGLAVLELRPDVSIGTFVAASVAVGQFGSSTVLLQGAVLASFSMGSAYRRLRPVLVAPADVPDGAEQPGRLRGRVELDEVSFTYPGSGRPVLDKISIAVEPGEFVAVVGPSGAGKSTLVRVLLGLMRPSSGSVRFDGRELGELDMRAVRAQLGVVVQQGRAIRGSIFDNVVAGAGHLTESDVWRALQLAGLAEEVQEMPMMLETMVGESNVSFSGGQIQRLMLARALVKRPPVLVLDEATSALDNVTQRKVTGRIAGLDVTRIVVAHRLSTIRSADRIYVVDGGVVVGDGTFEELLLTCPLFVRLVARQELN